MGKGDRVKKRTRRVKRRYQGNQHTHKSGLDSTSSSATQQPTTPRKTASSSKLQNIETDTPKERDKFIDGYRFVDMEVLSTVISLLLCPICQLCSLTLREKFSKKLKIWKIRFWGGALILLNLRPTDSCRKPVQWVWGWILAVRLKFQTSNEIWKFEKSLLSHLFFGKSIHRISFFEKWRKFRCKKRWLWKFA